MASACVRNMTLNQNVHVIPQNCILISTQNCLQQSVPGNQFNQNLNKIPIVPNNKSPKKNQELATTTSVLGMNGVNVQSINGSKYKKKYAYAHVPYGEQPPSVARRNARERNRVKQVNNGFANLRQHIPQTIITALTNGGRGASKKLSKVDTLRLAVEYIRRLQELLEETRNGKANQTSQNTTTQVFYPSSPDNFSVQNKCLDSSPSPTPSYNSDVSIGNNYIQSSGHFKFEAYENYSSMRSEDEELLDYISSWQDQ